MPRSRRFTRPTRRTSPVRPSRGCRSGPSPAIPRPRIQAAREPPSGRFLESAARVLRLQVSPPWRLVDGDRFPLGRWVIPDVSVWAFQTKVGETSPVIEGPPAFYVFRLDSLTAAGVRPLAEVRDQAVAGARYEKKKAVARQQAVDLYAKIKGTPNLERAALAEDVPAATYGPFAPLTPPPARGSA